MSIKGIDKKIKKFAKKPKKEIGKLISMMTDNSVKTDEKLKEISTLCLKREEIG